MSKESLNHLKEIPTNTLIENPQNLEVIKVDMNQPNDSLSFMNNPDVQALYAQVVDIESIQVAMINPSFPAIRNNNKDLEVDMSTCSKYTSRTEQHLFEGGDDMGRTSILDSVLMDMGINDMNMDDFCHKCMFDQIIGWISDLFHIHH